MGSAACLHPMHNRFWWGQHSCCSCPHTAPPHSMGRGNVRPSLALLEWSWLENDTQLNPNSCTHKGRALSGCLQYGYFIAFIIFSGFWNTNHMFNIFWKFTHCTCWMLFILAPTAPELSKNKDREKRNIGNGCSSPLAALLPKSKITGCTPCLLWFYRAIKS